MIKLQLRFYEELNDFLPYEKKKISFEYRVSPNTAIKDVIESLSVPHTEVDLIIVNGESVNFNYKVKNGDTISVYPVFEALDISPIVHLRPKPLRETKFILDVHLGKLAKYLRLLGFDVLYENHFSDEAIAEISHTQKRIVLTRDMGLLRNKNITHGHWMRQTNPEKQVIEVLTRFDLTQQCHPFTRCMECNGILEKVDKNKIVEELPELAREYFHNFMRCSDCKRIYWEGTHYEKLKAWVQKILLKSVNPI